MMGRWYVTSSEGCQLLNGKLAAEIAIRQARRVRVGRKVGKVIVTIFEPSYEDYTQVHVAAEISAARKVEIFSNAGVRCERYRIGNNSTIDEVEEFFSRCSDSVEVTAVIVQSPVPPKFIAAMSALSDLKDLDCVVEGRGPSATASAVATLARPFLSAGATTAVIGGAGRVGGAITSSLIAQGCNPTVIELGDNLAQIADFDVVISAVGQPSLIGPIYMKPRHALLLDVGFSVVVRGEDIAFLGDFCPSSYKYSEHASPVPGGVGPVQIASLLERLLGLIGHQSESWEDYYLG